MGVGDRLRTVFRLFLLLAVLAAVAVVSAITTIRIATHGRQENMPKLVGTSLESAQRITASLGLELKVVDKLYSPQYPANTVAQQMPPQGTPLKMGQRVHVLVSLGPPNVTVPNLVGASVRAARISAMEHGLSVGDVALIPWPGDIDQVVAQDPPAATADERSPVVNLLVSGGEQPPSFLCPRFIGQPLVNVSRILAKNSFKIGPLVPIITEGGPKGIVLTQSPASGSKIGRDAVFSLQVAE